MDEFHNFYEKRVEFLPKTYAQLKECDLWHEVTLKASDTLLALNWDKTQTVWGFGAV